MLLLFIFIRTCGETTKSFVHDFCQNMRKIQKDSGRQAAFPKAFRHLAETNELFCIANFLHPHYKGDTLKKKRSTAYDNTLSKIKDMCQKLRLDKQESPGQHNQNIKLFLKKERNCFIF